MAETNGSRPARWRGPRIIDAVLLLSLALNFFVIGGYAYSLTVSPPVVAPPKPENRMEQLAEKLGIDPAASKPFRDWRRAMGAAQGLYGQATRPLADDIWTALNRPNPDPAEIQAIFDTMATHRRAFQQDATASLVKFLATLTPEQREKFFEIVTDRRDPLGQGVRAIGN